MIKMNSAGLILKTANLDFLQAFGKKNVFIRDDPTDRYIYSTGAVAEGGKGVAMYFRGIYFFAMVSTGKDMWNLTIPGPVRNNTWNEIGLRWSKETGLEIFINGDRTAYVQYPDSKSGPTDQPMELTVGCRKNADGEYVDFAIGEFDELTAWMWALEKDQEHFYLGGHDPNSDCNPDDHPLKCETNIQKILENIDDIEINDVDSLVDALDHLHMLSEVEKDPAGSENEDDDKADNRYKEEVRALVAIIEKLIDKTWDKPSDLSVKDLEKLMAIQEIVSNILEEKYFAGWEDMTNEGKSSITFVNKVTSYQLKKTTQTDSGKEPIKVGANSSNILTAIRRSQLYGVLSPDKPISFPPVEDSDEDYSDEEDESRRKKREAGDENEETQEEENKEDNGEEGENEEEEPPEETVKLIITKELFGELDRKQNVAYVASGYKKLNKISPLWNKRTGNETTLIFIDSEIVSVMSDPNASSSNLQREPVVITLKHTRKVPASGRHLLASKDLQENGEIRKRECVRWDPNLQAKESSGQGAWTPDSCSMANSTAEESTCQCKQLGTYAVIAKIRKPFYIPEEDEWVKITKWIGYGLSIILLIFYIIVIIIRKHLHEQFHIIRLNLALAALGALISFLLSGFLYDDENTCRILSILIHLFYTAVGMWLASEAFALFSALVTGNFSPKYTLYIMIGWVFPVGMCGGCFSVIHNYGYDYICLVGPTPSMRMLLIAPIVVSTMIALTFSILTCINYGTPAVKRTAIVNELSSATRFNFIVNVYYFATWIFAIFAIVDLGFDEGEIPAFNPIFQIMNSFLGIFIVVLIGLGSKHFRYCLCHSEQNKTKTKNLNLDPFDIHDLANVSNRKKIYAS